MNVVREVEAAHGRIASHVRLTPLDLSYPLSYVSECTVLLKLENLQHTGSFKLRGAMNKLLSLPPVAIEKGIVTASTGNHGAATAFGTRKLGIKSTIFVPEGASPAKVRSIQMYGGEIFTHGTDSGHTEMYAREYARAHDLPYISPYDDPQVVGGQGTVGVELLKQQPQIDAIFVPVGGGGLVSGIAGYLRTHLPHVRIIGCQPENSPAMLRSVAAGLAVDIDFVPSLADGIAGNIAPGALTVELCRDLVDEFVLVSEQEIRQALVSFIEAHHMLIEGAAAVAVAAFHKRCDAFTGKNVVLVLSGANISMQKLKEILE